MLLLRLFARGLVKMFVRRHISRMSRSSRLNSVGDMHKKGDSFTDAIMDQITILEALELAAEAPGMIARARDAASEASVSTFMAVYDVMNPGQRALSDNYCLEVADNYWQETDAPDPDSYTLDMYGQHEAIERALSHTVGMSYEAGRSAGITSLYEDLSAYISEALLSKGMTMMDVKRAKSNWGRLSDEVAEMEIMGVFSGPGWRTRRGEEDNFGNSMYVSRRDPLARRELSGSQFMGADQPYWHTEQRRMWMAQMQGHMPRSEYESKRNELYRATHKRPFATSPPPGYRPYDGPEWGSKGTGKSALGPYYGQ